MTSKKMITTTKEKNMARQISRVKLVSAIITFGLLVSQTVYAADEAASSGIPGWVWGLLVIAILVGVTLLPKKWIDPTHAKKSATTTPPQAPIARKVETPQAKAPQVDSTPQAVEETIAAAPIVAPVVVEAVQEVTKEEPIAEVIDPLEEAKQLLAQQRFPQAVGVLNKGLQKDPERSDLILELLAIYAKQNHHEEFDALFEQLKQQDDPLALIQAEELHNQLERPIVAEESDLIEYDAKKAVIDSPEPIDSASIKEETDYTADSLAFTSEKPAVIAEHQQAEPTHDAESASIGKIVETTPIETEFSLDDIDFSQPTVETKEATVEVSAKESKDDLDFSDFDDFVISAPAVTKAPEPEVSATDLAPTEAEVLLPVTELKAPPAADISKANDLVDLEFDLDDNFSIDEDKVDTAAQKSEWVTDLADENFSSAEPTPVVAPTVGELIGNAPSSLEEEFPFLQSADTFQIRLDLARNYIALGEVSSAKELLNEVAEQGTGTVQAEAKDLIAKLAS